MKHKLKTTLFAGLVWTAGSILSQGTLRAADTIVYAIRSAPKRSGRWISIPGFIRKFPRTPLTNTDWACSVASCTEPAASVIASFRLNPSTGVPTFAPALTLRNFGAQNGFGSTTTGLFAVGAGAGGLNSLYLIDPSTGAPTLIGSTGVIDRRRHRLPIGLERFQQTLLGSSNQLHRYSLQPKYIDGAATLIGAEDESSKKTGNPFSMVFTGGTLWANFYSAPDLGPSAPQPALRPWFRPARSRLSSDWLRIPSRRHRRRLSARWGILPRKGTGPRRSRSSTKAGPRHQRS